MHTGRNKKMEKAYFPMFVDISEKEILVVGGVKIAARRIRTLLDFTVHITVITPALDEKLRQYADLEKFRWVQRKYRESDITGSDKPDIVLAATGDTEVNAEIGRLCRSLGICVNVADKKEMCDFYFPSIVKTEEVVIGINSGGANPGATKRTREKIEEWLGK